MSYKHHIFLHIPKAGGSTLLDVIKRQYPAGQIYELVTRWGKLQQTTEAFKALSEAKRAKYQMLMGHMEFGLHNYFTTPSCYFTMLRNPVTRVVSTYEYAKEHTNHNHYKTIKDKQMSLLDFVKSGLVSHLENGMTKFISGFPMHETCTQKHFDTAITNIETHFAAIGLTERYDASLLLFKSKLEWASSPTYFQKNKTVKTQRTSYDAETVSYIASLNTFDLELYKYCEAKLERELSLLQPDINSQLVAFSSENEVYRNSNQWKDNLELFVRNSYKKVLSIFR